MGEIPKYAGCFVCGDHNAIGLKAKFNLEGDVAVTEVVAGALFEGYKSIYHGGILATLLDEVMIKAILACGVFAVTAEITVRYHLLVKTGDRIRFRGWITEQKGRIYRTEAEALSVTGEKYASAKGTCVEGNATLKAQLQESLE